MSLQNTNRLLIGPLRAAGACALVALMLLAATLSATAAAQGDLYGPEAPQDVAWIRIVNLASDALAADLNGTELAVAFGESSLYVPVEPGARTVTIEGAAVEIEAEPETFHTVVLLPDAAVVVADPALRDISRGLLGLMNLTQLPALTLATPDGAEVVTDVAPGAAAAIAVSPAVTALVVSDGAEILIEVPEHSFERGEAYTILVFEGEDGPAALLLTAGTG